MNFQALRAKVWPILIPGLPLLCFCGAVVVEHIFDIIFFREHASRKVSHENLEWTKLENDNKALVGDFTARLIVEIADIALSIAGIACLAICLSIFSKKMRQTSMACVIVILVSTIVAIGVTVWLFIVRNPLAESLPFKLTAQASIVANRQILDVWRIEFCIVIFIMMLAAITTGAVVASDIDKPKDREWQLAELTTILFSVSALGILFMFRLGLK